MKKIVAYLVTLGMMLTMIPSTVSAADTSTAPAVTAEQAEKDTDKAGAAVEAMKNMNTILALTDGADSTVDEYIKVNDDRFKTIESVKELINNTCTGDLKDEFLKKCDKSLLEKNDGLYKRNSGRFFFTFLTDNGVEIVDPAMDAFIAVTKKKDEMNDYGRVVFKAEGSKWKVSKYEFGYFTVNNSIEDLQAEASYRTSNLQTILNMLAYGAPEDSAEKITVNGVTYGRAKDDYQANGLNFLKELKELINENCTGTLKDDFMKQAEARFVEKNGVLYAAIGARGAYYFDISEGFTVLDAGRDGFTAVTKKNSDKDGYGKIFFTADDGKWKVNSYSFYSTLDDAKKTADFKELAGTWIYEVADGMYTAEVCSKYNGIITIKEDGTFTFKKADTKISTGSITSSVEIYSDGSEVPYLIFSADDSSEKLSGYYYKDSDMFYFGNGGMARLVRDKNYDEELNKLAVERIKNYTILDVILSGGLDNDNKEAFKSGDIPYYKVTDKKYTSIDAIKKFINENTTGSKNEYMLKWCDERFIEKDGVLYESNGGKGSVGTDTTYGVKITDKTDKSFDATTISLNGITGSGHTRAHFSADGDTWKISSMEYDTYSFNKSLEDYQTCVSSRVSTLLYCMEYINRGADKQENEKIKIDGVEYVKDAYQIYSIEGLKTLIMKNFSGQPKEMLLGNMKNRLIEKDGVLYRKAEPGQVNPDFNLNDGVKILSLTPDSFKAATVKNSQRDGYGIFEFVKEGERFLLSRYTFSSFNEERLFGGYVSTESGGLNLRENPNTSSKILVEIPKGTQLDIYESDTEGWYKTEYDGHIGYVSSAYIMRILDSDIPVTTTTTAASTTTTKSAATTTTTSAAASTTSTTTPAATTTTATTTSTKNSDLKAGDVTKDGVIDGRDSTAILTHYAKTSTGKTGDFDESQIKAAEVTKDGIIDARDATLILTYYAYTSTGHTITIDDYIAKNSDTSKKAE